MSERASRFLPYGLHSVEDEDVTAVGRALRSGVLTGGVETRRFEEELAEVCGVPHVVVCSSGTAALHLLCMALDLGPGQTLISPAMTFLASCTCALHVGANVDFADINPSTGLVKLQSVSEEIYEGMRAVVAVDYAGAPVDLAPVAARFRERGIFLIRDACHSLGAILRGRPVAADDAADASVFSFHPVKTVAAGEGGAVATRSADLADRIRRLREHGCERREAHFQGTERGPWVYECKSWV